MMGIRDFVSTVAQAPTLLALKKGMKPRPLTDRDCIAAHVERNAAELGDHSALVTDDDSCTWAEFNARANRFANALKAAGLNRGDTVSVAMENSIDYLAVIVATNKLGVTAALINTNLRERPLTHCISITESKKCIFGAEMREAIEAVKDGLELEEGSDYYIMADGDEPPPNWALDFRAASAGQSDANPPDTAETTLGETGMYIFTSGTTGLPKAAVMSNRRYLASAQLSAKAGLRLTPSDRLYICLPLYHGTALLVGAGAACASGASMFVRRRFSASAFLDEVRRHGCTAFIYVGEVCRYLTNTPARADDADSPLVKAMGNGLRPDVWLDFKRRFGLQRITEFYGASEGNVAFANLLNKDCTIGMTSAKIALVRYDVDADEVVTDDAGHCMEVAAGEPGLLLGQINDEAVFEGYTDQEATEKKVIRNALRDGDAWFNTGDLLREVDVGFNLGFPHYQFVDRVGDTFRWRSENVSTNEVGEIINGFPGIELCNVYGVEIPGADGRAGMAAIRLEEGAELDLAAFTAYVQRELAAYARPVFLRIQSEIDLTGTFKMVKGDLKREGYDVAAIEDPVYVMKPGGSAYEALDADYLQAIADRAAGF
jgi:citronellyl-CoA synthetase